MQVLPARRALADTLEVRRVLPHPQRTLVGPWCFADHFGPATLGAGEGGVGPHPHIGLQTVTWVLEGAFVHGDSIGSRQRIRPGELNLMTAGRGITHWEDPEPGPCHGLQLWLALPDAHRHIEPDFAHHADLPRIDEEGLRATLLVGTHGPHESPARVWSPMVGLDLEATADVAVLPLCADFEHALLVTRGRMEIDGQIAEPGTALYVPPGVERMAIATTPGSTAVLLGGEPLGESIVMWWNFVARTHEEVAEAIDTWEQGGFGDHTSFPGPPIPSPHPPLRLKPRS